MLENVYIKTGGTDKCFGSNSGGHGSGEMIELRQGVCWVHSSSLYALLQTPAVPAARQHTRGPTRCCASRRLLL